MIKKTANWHEKCLLWLNNEIKLKSNIYLGVGYE